MKTRSKILATVLATALLVTGTVFGTMAYLTDKDTVTNTMTVGDIDISLDEAKTDTDGKPVTPASRVNANTYKLIPGHSYTKDPTVQIKEGSEDSYIFITVDNGIADIESTETGYTNIATQITNAGWLVLDATVYPGVYYRTYVTTDTDAGYVVFKNFKISGTVDNETLASYKNETIVVNAYAVQQDGFASAKDAWSATFGKTN
jgi:predicted ribosomally synthesized peptide with SipW-like signal peptide